MHERFLPYMRCYKKGSMGPISSAMSVLYGDDPLRARSSIETYDRYRLNEYVHA